MTYGDLRDCIVVGGGAAGLSAALTLGRARRSTLVVDAGRQSNLAAAGIGGLLGHDGRSPAEYYAAGRAELARYPSVEVREGEVVRGSVEDDGTFTLVLGDGREERARRVILAMGMEYRHPRLPGVDERWGASVFHCPFCHGWEVRERPLGVLAYGAAGVRAALNLRSWTDEVYLLTNGGGKISDEQRRQLSDGGIVLDERPIAALNGPGSELESVTFSDGGELAIGGLLAKTPLYQRSSLARDLGAELIEPDEMLGVEAIKVDMMMQTGVAGLYAAGDVATSIPPSVAAAVASGHRAGSAVVLGFATGN
jgi:thioredoxin reductase